ncbi:hypothetical protein [uncultured Akkermansia sp.]|nr:hypothetical protein [uncultured Akkermansia sp.]
MLIDVFIIENEQQPYAEYQNPQDSDTACNDREKMKLTMLGRMKWSGLAC